VQAQQAAHAKGVRLADLSWTEAEKVLRPETVVVIPLGAESKEHGPHMKLSTDYKEAEYFTDQVLKNADVVVAPTLNYGFYPAFTEYPGSVNLSVETSRDTVVEICRSLAHFGPHRFYVINTGVSTVVPLQMAQDILARDGIILAFTGQGSVYLNTIFSGAQAVHHESAKDEVLGTHANDEETSLLLYIAPDSVDMSKAVKDYHPSNLPGLRKLVRDPNTPGTYSKSGIYGDATLATKEKGKKYAKIQVDEILREIEGLRKLGTHQ
jgi:creatinine amidohydrolase